MSEFLFLHKISHYHMDLEREVSKQDVFASARAYMDELGFNIVGTDDQRPWGGYFVIDESQAPNFIETFFSHLSLEDFSGFEKLSPKILIVAPEMRLSWQYHHRRSEIWKLIHGVAGVIKSPTDEETELRILEKGEVITLSCGERHRLVGMDGYGVIAEIWQHESKDNPSDEDDIVRVQDDFGR